MSLELQLVLMALVAYRLSRLLVEDEFPPIKWFRDKLTTPYESPADSEIRRTTKVPYWMAYLISCTWCVSVWTSGAVVLVTSLTMGVPAPFLVWLALAAVAGLISHAEDFCIRPDNG